MPSDMQTADSASVDSGTQEELESVEPKPSRPASTSAAGAAQSIPQVDQLWEQLRQRDAQMLMLQKKLQHYRSWMASVQHKFQQSNPQAIKNSRRLYIGGLTPDTTEEELKTTLNSLMMKTGGATGPGNSILSCKINQAGGPAQSTAAGGPVGQDKTYAFIELRNIEETSNAMAFDGMAYKDTYLKVRRPSNYDPAVALCLGPIHPDPTMDTSSQDICRTVVEDSPHKLFVGGLPCDWTEEQVKEVLLPHGTLRSFNLVMDKATSKSKGYAFCDYTDETMTDFAIQSLNGKKLGNKVLTVKRALDGSRSSGGASPRGGMSALGAAMGGTSPPGTSGGMPPFGNMFMPPPSQAGVMFNTPGMYPAADATMYPNGSGAVYTNGNGNGVYTNGNGVYQNGNGVPYGGMSHHRSPSSHSSYGGSPLSGGSPTHSITAGSVNGFRHGNGMVAAGVMGGMANLW